jgi:hydroxymethylpyrimidine pyrophosphatase-like HAD family hydrolase
LKTFIFDLDGTLFETSAILHTDADGNPDFREFNSTRLLLEHSEPKLALLALAKQVQDEGHIVYILTARQSCVAQAIMYLLKRYGITPKYVFCVGDRGIDVATYKAEILSELSDEMPCYFYDDQMDNLEAAAALELPNLKIYQA